MRIALTLAALIALGSSARAGSDVGVIVTGEGSMQPQLAAQLTDWLSRHGHTVVPSPLPPDAITALIDCFVIEDQACARGIVEKRGTSSGVIYARVDSKNNANNGTRDVTLTAYWFDKGHAAVSERKTCERCTDQTLRTAADELMQKLIGGGDLGHVKLKSAPPGARITIDGQAIGVTPLDWDLPPGKHTVQMDKAGRTTASRDVVVVSNRTDLVVLTMPAVGDDDRADRPSRMLPLGLVAAGGALLVTGGVLIAVDEDPGPKAPRYIHNTGPTGVGLAIAGVVAGGIGTYLLLRKHEPASAPVAGFTGDTAFVGWLGQF
jgi:hypothetical protein